LAVRHAGEKEAQQTEISRPATNIRPELQDGAGDFEGRVHHFRRTSTLLMWPGWMKTEGCLDHFDATGGLLTLARAWLVDACEEINVKVPTGTRLCA
jgi:hypothetical protein